MRYSHPTAGAIDHSPPAWRTGSTRQFRRTHQEFIDATGALAAFLDRPHHQRLAATHVAAGKDLALAGLVGGRRRLDDAARIKLDAGLFDPDSHHGADK